MPELFCGRTFSKSRIQKIIVAIVIAHEMTMTMMRATIASVIVIDMMRVGTVGLVFC